jgi:hypothetical protein
MPVTVAVSRVVVTAGVEVTITRDYVLDSR